MQIVHRAGGRVGQARGRGARPIAMAEAGFADTLPPPRVADPPRSTTERLAWPAAAGVIALVSAGLWTGILALGRLILG